MLKGIQKVNKGKRYPKGTLKAKESRRYLTIQGIQNVLKGSRYQKGTLWYYGIKNEPKGPRYPKCT